MNRMTVNLGMGREQASWGWEGVEKQDAVFSQQSLALERDGRTESLFQKRTGKLLPDQIFVFSLRHAVDDITLRQKKNLSSTSQLVVPSSTAAQNCLPLLEYLLRKQGSDVWL